MMARNFYALRLAVLAVALLWVSSAPKAVHRCRAFVVPVRRRRTFTSTRRTTFFRRRVTRKARRVDDDDDDMSFLEAELPGDDAPCTRAELEALTVSQLKQQLRLRGLRVCGRKSELVERLLLSSSGEVISAETTTEEKPSKERSSRSKAREFAEKRGKELIDVTAYLDDDEKTKDVRAWSPTTDRKDEDKEEENASTEPEVWGAEARILSDDDGSSSGRLVVDNLSRVTIEFRGSNQTYVQALVVASRDALKPFLAGAGGNQTAAVSAAEERLREIQLRREKAASRPLSLQDEEGLDEGDEAGIFKDILHRDFSDWGKYTSTGAQMSASEVQGVLLLSDVFGPFTDDTVALAEKIAFECQPVVVMVPDLFRGNPWTERDTGRTNADGQTYEEWRASTVHDLRVNVDIRAAAACLRQRYGVSSVVVWGTCYGGGRALEVGSGWFPDDNTVYDVDGVTVGPPPVDPMAVVAWYPTRYDAKELFGKNHRGRNETIHGEKAKVAVTAVFAGNDDIPGATNDDALELRSLLERDDRIVDHMVKVFPGKEHGFAHIGLSNHFAEGESDEFERFVDEEFGGSGSLSMGGGDAEAAFLLSTAFMETYSRVFLPTVGPPISLDEEEQEWSRELEMKDLEKANVRDVRGEIDEAINNFVEEPLLSGPLIDPNDESQEEELARLLRSMEDPDQARGPFKIEDDDDLATIYAKLTSFDDSFQIF